MGREAGRLGAELLRPLVESVIGGVLGTYCAACRGPLPAPLAGPVCAACWQAASIAARFVRAAPTSTELQEIVACGRYEEPVRRVLHALKHRRHQSIARPLGELMRRVGGSVLEGADAVVPVPLHVVRRRSRGFNQAEALARELGPPVLLALRKARASPPQSTLPAGRRALNVVDAFTLAGRSASGLWGSAWRGLIGRPAPPVEHALAGLTLVLVDDVRTTGATLDACARALRRGGALEVRALVMAQVTLDGRGRGGC